jgi:hypothetical protein
MQTADWIATWSFVVALASFIAAIASVYVAVCATRKSDKNASVAMLVTLSEAFRDGWQRVFSSIKAIQREPDGEDTRYTSFSELLNIFEIACAIMNEKSLAGFSKEIIHKYLVDSLELIIHNEYARSQIPRMLTDETTFEHIKTFIKSLRNQPLRFIIPVEWYEL